MTEVPSQALLWLFSFSDLLSLPLLRTTGQASSAWCWAVPEWSGLIWCSPCLLICLHTHLSYLLGHKKDSTFFQNLVAEHCRIYSQQPGTLSPTVSTVSTPLLCLDLCALVPLHSAHGTFSTVLIILSLFSPIIY